MANLKNAQYVALTTHGDGWWVVAMGEVGESKDAIDERAARRICGNNWGKAKTVEQDTEMKNLNILSVSAARRAFPNAMRNYEEHIEYQMLSRER